jgi:mono/diheme cytochrome c family protein
MQRPSRFLPLLLAFSSFVLVAAAAPKNPRLHEKRQQPSDLELSGALAGLPPESVRYISREDLLALPQTDFSVADDANFSGPTKIRGVDLKVLAARLGAAGTLAAAKMVVAICDDGYRANYPGDYIAAHHPVLVLEVNGKAPDGWPKAAEDHASSMGPYMISNPRFTPSFKVLAHSDEAQIPWGVVRLEFRDENIVFGAIAPRGMHARDDDVQSGFRIAKQNCFRCHNAGREGGRKSGIPWSALGAFAARSPMDFAAYVRAPQAKNPQSQMSGNPEYDDETLHALAAYFQSFASPTKP